MHYYDFAYLLEVLDIPFDDDKWPNDEENITKARETIQELDDASADIVRKWLEKFAKITFVEADAEIAKAISEMKDGTAVLHYFSKLFTQFWC